KKPPHVVARQNLLRTMVVAVDAMHVAVFVRANTKELVVFTRSGPHASTVIEVQLCVEPVRARLRVRQLLASVENGLHSASRGRFARRGLAFSHGAGRIA